MKEHVLITIHSGSLEIFPDVLRYVHDWCVEHGYPKARIRQGPNGHEIYTIVPTEAAPTELLSS